MSLSIIIPCYNEIENIPKLLNDLHPVVDELSNDWNVEVIFVDDGSTDGTRAALEESFIDKTTGRLCFIFKSHEINRGLGAALRTGFDTSKGEIIVTTDSDGTYDYVNIPVILSFLAPGIDIVTASPYHPSGNVEGVPGYRLLLSRGSSLIYRLLVDTKIHTYTALFRCYRRKVIELVPSNSDSFLAGTEILVRAMLQGFDVVEFPTVLRVREYGVSKTRIMQTIVDHFKFQLRILGNRLKLNPLSPIAGEKTNT